MPERPGKDQPSAFSHGLWRHLAMPDPNSAKPTDRLSHRRQTMGRYAPNAPDGQRLSKCVYDADRHPPHGKIRAISGNKLLGTASHELAMRCIPGHNVQDRHLSAKPKD